MPKDGAGEGADTRRSVPSLDALLRSGPGRRASATFGRALLKQTLAETLDEVRTGAGKGVEPH